MLTFEEAVREIAAATGREIRYVPVSTEEYAAAAKRARDAGASVVHIHARYPDGTPSYRVEEYRAITQAILAEAPDLIINYSTGAVGIPMEERVHQITELKPELGALILEVPIYSGVRHGGVSTTSLRSAARMYWGAVRMWRRLRPAPDALRPSGSATGWGRW